MTMFALVVLTVIIQNMETKQYQVQTKPISLYASAKECDAAKEALQKGLPRDAEAHCVRTN